MKRFLYLLLLLLVLCLGYVLGRTPRQRAAAVSPATAVANPKEPAELPGTTGEGDGAEASLRSVPTPSPTISNLPAKTVVKSPPIAPSPSGVREAPPVAPSATGVRQAPPVATKPTPSEDDWIRQHDLEMQRLADQRRKAKERRIRELEDRVAEIRDELNQRFWSIVDRNQLSESDIASQKELEEDLREAEADLAQARHDRR